jgi:hypothetical protein
MPRCKNDPVKSYKGDEPSPKGLGYCAHAEPVLASKTGRDGRPYEVRLNKNGVKSWKLAPKGVNKGRHFVTTLLDSFRLPGFLKPSVVKSGIPHASRYQYDLSFKLNAHDPVKMSNVDKFVQSATYRKKILDFRYDGNPENPDYKSLYD